MTFHFVFSRLIEERETLELVLHSAYGRNAQIQVSTQLGRLATPPATSLTGRRRSILYHAENGNSGWKGVTQLEATQGRLLTLSRRLFGPRLPPVSIPVKSEFRARARRRLTGRSALPAILHARTRTPVNGLPGGFLRWTPKMRQLAKVEPCP